ncbi:MAG: STAS domain-containing protein [Pirellulales bacterium]
MVQTATDWQLEVDRGPDWLFIRLQPPEARYTEAPDLVERLWSLISAHFTYRIVLEVDDLKVLPSFLIGQLVMLQKRLHQHGGLLRLCGLSAACQQTLHTCRLDDNLRSYETREHAVLGRRPMQPR